MAIKPNLVPETTETNEPQAIRFADTTLKLWGDPTTNYVSDRLYVTSETIHQVVISMPPGGGFLHSERYPTVTGADQLYYVLNGTFMLANPETGEVQRLDRGDAVSFHAGTWQRAFSRGTEELRVLEIFAPGPAVSMSEDFYETESSPTASHHLSDRWLGQWPAAAEDARSVATLNPISPQDILWRIEGQEHQTPVGIYMSTDKLTVGYMELLPGESTDIRVHGGGASGYVLEGTLNLLVPYGGGEERVWFEMSEADGFYVPPEVPHRYFNMSGEIVRFFFAVGLDYSMDLEE